MIEFVIKQINDISNKGIGELKKKFFIISKFFLLLPFYILAFFVCIIIRILKPFLVIRIDSLPSNFGDFSLWTTHYYSKKKLGIDEPNSLHLDFIYLGAKYKNLYNKQLLKMWKRKLKIYPKYPLHFIYFVNKLLPGWKNHIISTLSTRPLYGYKYYSERREDQIDYLLRKIQPINFTDDEEKLGKKLLRQFGVETKDKFVCFAIRDHTYSDIKLSGLKVDSSYHNYRHTKLENFELAAKFLAEKGYFVFRVGRKAEEEFNVNHSRVIDYANLKLKNDFLDIYLGAKCFFCLSTGFGFDDLPLIFNRPLALINTPIVGLRARTNNQIFLTKHHFSIQEKKNLTLSEIFSKNVASAYYNNEYLGKGIKLIDNTPEEIKDLVEEMVDMLNNETNDEKANLPQLQFKKIFLENLNRWDKKNLTHHQNNEQSQIKGQFSNSFLKNNQNWLK